MLTGTVFGDLFGEEKVKSNDKVLGRAWQHMRFYECDQALPLFRQVANRTDKGAPQWVEARYGQALALRHKRPPGEETIGQAVKILSGLIEDYPDSKVAPYAMINLARIYEVRDYYQDPIRPGQAKKVYQRVIDEYDEDEHELLIGEATLRLAQCYINSFERGDIEKGISLMKSWIERHPEGLITGIMWAYLGDVYFYPLKDYKNSVEAYIRADEMDSLDPGTKGKYYWRVARLADEELNKRDIAIRYYKKLITDEPSYGKGYQSQLRLKEMGVEPPSLKMAWKRGIEKSPDDEGNKSGNSQEKAK